MGTCGDKSSEKRAVYYAFLVNIGVIIYGIHKGSQLNELGDALWAADALVMTYVGGRSYVKSKKGDVDGVS